MSAGLTYEPPQGLAHEGLPILDTPIAVVAPRVNLLPPEVMELRAVRRLALGLAGAVALCAVGVGGGFLYSARAEAPAQADLNSATSTHAGLVQQQQALAPAQVTQQQLLTTQKSLAAAMGNEVLWSRYLDNLRLKRPDGIRFSQVALQPVVGGASTASPSGATATTVPTSGIASLSITGTASSSPAVAALLDQLATIHGFTNVYLTSTSSDSPPLVTYTVTASVTADALSHRYVNGGS
jgi:Tfp pilus assembly protein PilN